MTHLFIAVIAVSIFILGISISYLEERVMGAPIHLNRCEAAGFIMNMTNTMATYPSMNTMEL